MEEISYHVYITCMYHDKNGNPKTYRRTRRNDYHNETLKKVYNLLQNAAKNYLVHCCNILLDKVFW